jgi:hypothetical protein
MSTFHATRFTIIALFIIAYDLMGISAAAPPTDLNHAVREVTQEINTQLPQDSTAVALIPLNSAQSELRAMAAIVTSLLAYRFADDMGERFVGMERTDWENFPTDSELLSADPRRVKRYGQLLSCQWVVTGQVAQPSNLSVHVNLFLWSVHTGALNRWLNFQLPPSEALTTLYSTTSSTAHQPYYRKWRSTPERDKLMLAVEVADVDGDGFNEVVIADEKRVEALVWKGFDFQSLPHLPEIQYRPDDTPIPAQVRRTMLATDRDGNDRDELYIGSPPDSTWRVEWRENAEPSIDPYQPIFLAQGEGFFIAAKTAKRASSQPSESDQNPLDYIGKSTVCFRWRAGGNPLRQPCSLPVDYHSMATRVMTVDSTERSGEIFVVAQGGHLQAYRISPNATRLSWQTPPIFGEGVAAGDLNGDGEPEIVVTIDEAENRNPGRPYDGFIILEKRSNLYTVGWTSPLFEGKIIDLKIADADNDDRDELIVCLRTQKGSQLLMYAATD